jgi:hypothetical protein
MASHKKEPTKKDKDRQEHDEINELNELVEKARLQKKVLSKMMDQINKPKINKK